ncbi:MAG: hypothetical protein GX803_00765 [Lentisphaerae bacterium]|nr:hypothetical protein [Lentisphaerota bacterium]
MTTIRRISFVLALLVATGALAQQRMEFPRQKFDRSRFERATPAAPPETPSAPAPAEPTAPPVATAPFAQPSAPAPDAPPSSAAIDRPAAFAPFPGAHSVSPEYKALIDNPKFDDVPKKVFKDYRDYDTVMQLQKETGACVLLYFQNPFEADEKGLCAWYEKRIATTMPWRKLMRNYIQLEITVTGRKEIKELVEKYRANKTPGIFIIQPGSDRGIRIWPFYKDYANQMRLKELDDVLKELKEASTPAYAQWF